MLTKRSFWKAEQKMKCRCSTHFQGFVAQIEYSHPWKCIEHLHFIFCSTFQNLRLVSINFKQLYPSQTKILDGRTNVSECFFEALFKGVSTRFGLQIVEKCFEKSFWNAVSAFRNLRLGSINLFWKPRFGQTSTSHTIISMLSSSCDSDRHIAMLSSSCDFDRHIVMLIWCNMMILSGDVY